MDKEFKKMDEGFEQLFRQLKRKDECPIESMDVLAQNLNDIFVSRKLESLKKTIQDNINIPDKNGNYFIHYVVARKHLGLLSAVFLYSPDLNVIDAYGRSPLHVLSDSPNTKKTNELFFVLLEKGADSRVLNKSLENVFLSVVKNGGLDNMLLLKVLKGFLENIDSQDRFKETALSYAIHQKHFEGVRMLIEWGADINIQTGSQGNTALHQVIFCGLLEGAELLLKYEKVQVDKKNFFDKTPIELLSEKYRSGEASLSLFKGVKSLLRKQESTVIPAINPFPSAFTVQLNRSIASPDVLCSESKPKKEKRLSANG